MSTTSADRLNEISDELKSILDARLQELAKAMRGAEQVTRTIVSTEMEIGRYQQISADSGREMATLRREAEAARDEAERAGAHRAVLVGERDGAREAQATAERESRELAAQIADFRSRQTNFEREGEALRREAAELTTRVKTAEENVARLRRVRDELIQQMSALSMSTSKE